MGLNLGLTAISKMYRGSTQLSAAYLGTQSLLGSGGGSLDAQLPIWAAARAAVNAQTADATICVVGDSTSMGCQANTGLTFGYGLDGFNSNWTAFLAALLNRGSSENFSSTHGMNGAYSGSQLCTVTNDHDYRLNVGPNWVSTVVATYGGNMWTSNTPNTDVLTFTPKTPCDYMDVWWQRSTNNGNFGWTVDGGAVTEVDTAGTSAFVKTVIPCGSLGMHTLSLARTGNGSKPVGPINFGLIRAYNSAQKEVTVLSGGWSSGNIAQAANVIGAWAYTNALKAFAPKLTIIMMTINDWAAATDVTAFTNNTQVVITAAKLSGDVILLCGIPTNPVSTPDAQQQIYRDIYTSLGVSNSIPVLDVRNLTGDYATAVALGYYRDSKHYLAAGYSALASAFKPYIA
jgi:lysophospholipase L1-like esterase